MMTRLLLLAFLLLSFPALADEGETEETYSSGSHTVTSVEECLEQLSPEDAADIRATSIKPYEDCNRRLQRQRLEKKETAKRKKAEDEEAETHTNFLRVTEEPEEDEEAEEAEEKPARKKKKRD